MIEVFGYEILFRHPERLWAIIVAVLTITTLFVWNFRAGAKELAQNQFLRLHSEDAQPHWRPYLIRALGFSLLFALLIGAWAEPERRHKNGEPVYGGVRLAFLWDVSLSMKYAHDVAPYKDRLHAAKSVLEDFAAMTVRDPELHGEYWRAIIPFAGSAITYLPFSASYSEFISAVNGIDETTINDPGTNFLGPVKEYELLLKEYPKKTPQTADIVVLISDGGRGEGAHKDMPYIKAALLRMTNTAVFTVGIGSVEVTKLPDGTEIRRSLKVPLVIQDREGRVTGYATADPKDPKSERQYSELDERILESIAGSKDRYVHYTGRDALLAKLKQMIIENRQLVDTIVHTKATSIAQWFLIPALFMAGLLLGYFRRLFGLLLFFPSKIYQKISS